MGRKKVAANCLEWLLGLPNIEIVGVLTDSHLDRSVTRDVAIRAKLPLYSYDEATIALDAGKLVADLGVSMLYWRKLKGPFLVNFPLGIVNFHPAPLPNYKGVGGYNLAVLEGFDHWAVSAHYVDEGIDEGDIIEVSQFDIDRNNETALSLEAISQTKLLDQFRRVVSNAVTSDTRLETTSNGAGRYLSRKELEALKEIDPIQDDIERKARAFWFPPYDGAYVDMQGQRFTLVPRVVLEQLADPDSSSLFSSSASSSATSPAQKELK